jgi:hypothetical protein
MTDIKYAEPTTDSELDTLRAQVCQIKELAAWLREGGAPLTAEMIEICMVVD